MPQPRVVVVGAGLAGLSAAFELSRRGHQVTVVEARDRVCGRVWSQQLGNGVVVERGGEFVSARHESVRWAVEVLGLRLVRQGCEFDRRELPGADVLDAERVRRAARDVGEAITVRLAAGAADFSVAEAYVDALASPEGAAAYCRLETSKTMPLEWVSARWYAAHAGDAYGDASRVDGGNQRLATGLADALPEPVHTGVAVTRVAQVDGQVEVECTDGSRRADALVLAVPLPVLASLDISPALPGDVGEALDNLGFGDAAKLHLPIAGGVTPRSVEAGKPWWTWNRLGNDARPEAALNGFAGGAAVLEELEVTEGVTCWAEAAAAMRRDVDVLEPALLTHWGADPWAGGSYSGRLVGWHEDQLRALQRAHGRIVLAGEHTEPDGATMNAAIRSGQRAAAMVADHR